MDIFEVGGNWVGTDSRRGVDDKYGVRSSGSDARAPGCPFFHVSDTVIMFAAFLTGSVLFNQSLSRFPEGAKHRSEPSAGQSHIGIDPCPYEKNGGVAERYPAATPPNFHVYGITYAQKGHMQSPWSQGEAQQRSHQASETFDIIETRLVLITVEVNFEIFPPLKTSPSRHPRAGCHDPAGSLRVIRVVSRGSSPGFQPANCLWRRGRLERLHRPTAGGAVFPHGARLTALPAADRRSAKRP